MNNDQPVAVTFAKEKLWILDLTAPERSTLVATFLGWALDGMDVMVYSFVIPTLIAAWHISKGQAGMLGTAALLISVRRFNLKMLGALFTSTVPATVFLAILPEWALRSIGRGPLACEAWTADAVLIRSQRPFPANDSR